MVSLRCLLALAAPGAFLLGAPRLARAAPDLPPPSSAEVIVPPTITLPPQSHNRVGGPDVAVTLTIAATGSAPLSYQWYCDGSPLSGAIGERLTVRLPAVTTESRHAYQVVVSNPVGSVSSTAAIVTNLPPILAR